MTVLRQQQPKANQLVACRLVHNRPARSFVTVTTMLATSCQRGAAVLRNGKPFLSMLAEFLAICSHKAAAHCVEQVGQPGSSHRNLQPRHFHQTGHCYIGSAIIGIYKQGFNRQAILKQLITTKHHMWN